MRWLQEVIQAFARSDHSSETGNLKNRAQSSQAHCQNHFGLEPGYEPTSKKEWFCLMSPHPFLAFFFLASGVGEGEGDRFLFL